MKIYKCHQKASYALQKHLKVRFHKSVRHVAERNELNCVKWQIYKIKRTEYIVLVCYIFSFISENINYSYKFLFLWAFDVPIAMGLECNMKWISNCPVGIESYEGNHLCVKCNRISVCDIYKIK